MLGVGWVISMGGLGLSCFKLEARAQCKEPVMHCERRRLTVPNSFHYGPWDFRDSGTTKGLWGAQFDWGPCFAGTTPNFRGIVKAKGQ